MQRIPTGLILLIPPNRCQAESVGQIEPGKQPLYEEVAARIGGLIDQGTCRPGERIPSIRALSRQMQVSVNTVMEACARIENIGKVEARPQSGYYVRSTPPEPGADMSRGGEGALTVATTAAAAAARRAAIRNAAA